jgi:phosphoglycolate phosphatase-like HAD superfamily hydrolase
MTKYFASVTGAPTGKLEAFRLIIEQAHLQPAYVLAIGDSVTEWAAASEAGIPFIAIAASDEQNPFPDGLPAFPNLEILNAVWD